MGSGREATERHLLAEAKRAAKAKAKGKAKATAKDAAKPKLCHESAETQWRGRADAV